MKVMKLPGLHCSREKPLGEEPSWKTGVYVMEKLIVKKSKSLKISMTVN